MGWSGETKKSKLKMAKVRAGIGRKERKRKGGKTN